MQTEAVTEARIPSHKRPQLQVRQPMTASSAPSAPHSQASPQPGYAWGTNAKRSVEVFRLDQYPIPFSKHTGSLIAVPRDETAVV